MDTDKTDVIFVIWPNDPKHIFDPVWDSFDALFPGLAGNMNPDTCLCYSHIGQHSAANLDYMLSITRLAKPSEYSDLKGELEQIGYSLNIIEKPTEKHRQQRINQINRGYQVSAKQK